MVSKTTDSLHIGFIFYDFTDSRAIDVIQGLTAQQGNDHFTFFPTGPLNSQIALDENNRKKVLDVVKNSQLDGLITLQFWESEAWIKELLLDHVPFPVLPILRDYPDNPSATTSFYQGSYDAVAHLLNVHGCRKPYYLVGSTTATKTLDERFLGFKQALEDAGVAYTNQMHVSLQGSFNTGGLISGTLHQGGDAIDILFNQRQLKVGRDVDALVVFNDRMAFEVLEALKKLNIRVPEDIRIVSFDNTPESETAPTPLSSSAIDWYQLGKEGLGILRNIINKKPKQATIKIPSKLVVRRSCGCTSSVEKLTSDEFRNHSEAEQQEIFQTIIHEFNHTRDRLLAIAHVNRDFTILKNAAMTLAKSNSFDDFSITYGVLLRHLNLNECSIYLADPHNSDQYSRHMHWFNDCNDYKSKKLSTRLTELDLMNTSHEITVCESLDQGDTHIGFLIFGASDCSFVSFGELRDLLSGIFYSLLLNENLRETQEQLMQKEKFAALGRLVSGVAHEVNTPLGIGVTASSHLVKETDDLRKKFTEGSLSKKEFNTTLDNISDSSHLILNNLRRADELIRSFKNISVTNTSGRVQIFNLKELINDVYFTMNLLLKEKSLAFELNCDSDFEYNGNPAIFSQVISNLMNNSAKHAYPSGEAGVLKFTVEPTKENEILINYQDDGIGMDQATLDKIYEPFFTTRPNQGGSGLGMFTVFNIVTQKLNGKLNIYSKPGKGTRVEIRLPPG